MTVINLISKELDILPKFVEATIDLLEGGATIPFISRYRKEATGALDEVKIQAISDKVNFYNELAKRKETIIKTIESQDKLTGELRERIENCYVASELEDIYLPYKPKRHTRAEAAREKGLEPLARIIMSQKGDDIHAKAEKFVSDKVENADDAIAGAQDIIAEWISEKEAVRNAVRGAFRREAMLTSNVVKGKEAEGANYRSYFKFKMPLRRCT
ncbi:MAG: RNA-binding transcriptional accessory protein, partial [Bacteroidaceae bacterium]|nr:RNA-binding transcriptional accessory protein [Bacteroidaceae bacterium]